MAGQVELCETIPQDWGQGWPDPTQAEVSQFPGPPEQLPDGSFVQAIVSFV